MKTGDLVTLSSYGIRLSHARDFYSSWSLLPTLIDSLAQIPRTRQLSANPIVVRFTGLT